MKDITSKEKILKRIREALINPPEYPAVDVDLDKSIYAPSNETIDVQFVQEFTKVDGKFVFAESNEEFVNQFAEVAKANNWQGIYCYDEAIASQLQRSSIEIKNKVFDVTQAKVAITRCESLVARIGGVLMSSKLSSARKLPAIVDIHVVVAYTSQLVPDIKDAFESLKTKYGERLPSLVYLATGPSRTADIEKTLVMGAHGPKEIYVFLILD